MLTMEMCKHKVYSNRKEHGKRQEKFRQTNVVKKKRGGQDMILEHAQQEEAMCI